MECKKTEGNKNIFAAPLSHDIAAIDNAAIGNMVKADIIAKNMTDAAIALVNLCH